MTTRLRGYSGSVIVGGSTFCVTEWSVSESAEREEVTDSCDGDVRTYATRSPTIEGTAKGYWDTASIPTSASNNIYAGVSATIVCRLGSSGKAYSIPATITNANCSNPVNGFVTYEITFVNTAAYTRPS